MHNPWKKTLRWIVALELLTVPLLLHAADDDAPDGLKDPPPTERTGRPGDGRFRALTDADEDQIIKFVEQHMPQHHQRLLDLRDTNPRRYRMTLRFLWPRVQRLRAMPEATRKAHLREVQIKVQLYKTTRAYQTAESEGEKLQIKQDLRTLLGEQFNLEQTLQAYRLKQLQEQLKRLQEELEHRNANRQKIIDQRLEDLLSGQRPDWMRRPGRRGGPRMDRGEQGPEASP